MFNRLVELLEEVAEIDIATTSTFRAMVLIRDQLEISIRPMLTGDLVFTHSAADLAEEISTRAEISIDKIDLSDEDIQKLVEPFVTTISNMVGAMLQKGFSDDAIKNVASRLSLILTE